MRVNLPLARCARALETRGRTYWSKASVRLLCRLSAVAFLVLAASDMAHAADSDITSMGSDLWGTVNPMMEKFKWAALLAAGGFSGYRFHKSHNYAHFLLIPATYVMWDKVFSWAAQSVTAAAL